MTATGCERAVWAAVVAVVGTLAGGLVTGLVQGWSARVARAADRGDARRAAVLGAVTALVAAVADHRRAMWLRESLRLAGADDAAARAASHGTRSAVTAPLTTVRLLAPALAGPAQRAVAATYALRDAADSGTLAELRSAAVRAVDRLVDAAAVRVGQIGPVHSPRCGCTSDSDAESGIREFAGGRGSVP